MRYGRRERLAALCALVVAGLCFAAPAQADDCPRPKSSLKGDVPRVEYPGMQRIRYCFGPIQIKPGQNDLNLRPNVGRPTIPGYITRFKPNLTLADGTVPRVDVLHLHHAVWLINGNPTFAAGEEKTIIQAPKGFGWTYKPSDSWLLNDMIHNLTPTPATVYITYDIDFVPATSPAAASMRTVRTKWMDVAGVRAYPVYNARMGYGSRGRFTFPDQAPQVEKTKAGPAQTWTVPRPLTLMGAVGHLHPGGLWDDLRVTRDGVTKTIFRSRAKYWEPAGPVSWDVAMTATPPGWRIKLKPGDVVSISSTYDVSRSSWYEVMGILPVAVYDGVDVGGVDPFTQSFPKTGQITHGPLAENRNHGGEPSGLPDPRTLKGAAPAGGTVDIRNFYYSQGDLNRRTSIPTVQQGQTLTFRNDDAQVGIQHTVTACKAPCTQRTGIAFPLANGGAGFDSTTLGFGPAGFTPASNTDTWSTPDNLDPGTYTYFCRIHPFMRGAFRVRK